MLLCCLDYIFKISMLRHLGLCFIFFAILGGIFHAIAEEPSNKSPVEITAEKFFYSRDEKRASATGAVEVNEGDQLLNADHVVYYQDQDKILAEGNISLLREDGSIFFAKKAQLERAMRRGKILQFYSRMSQKGLFAGSAAEMTDQNHIKVYNAVYSPCQVCKSNVVPFMPLWQIKAEEAMLDKEKQEIVYRNAKMEALGIPILYTPYLSTPSPKAQRKSGVLMPRPTWSNDYGASLHIPYYFNIAPEADATITPWFHSRNGHLLEGEFRHLTEYGKYQIHGTIIRTTKYNKDGTEVLGKKETKAHIDTFGEFLLPNNMADSYVGFDITRMNDSSRTYLKKYKINQSDVLRQNIFMRNFQQYNYLFMDTLHFQSLRPQDKWNTTPRAIPWVRLGYNHKFENNNSELAITSDLLKLHHNEEENYTRFSTNANYGIPFILPYGQLLKIAVNLRMDAYNTHIVNKTSTLLQKNIKARKNIIYPALQLDWSTPLINFTQWGAITVEPIINAIISPNMRIAENAVNEDSQWFELSAFNLFQKNRFLGIDRLETGSRINYGVKASLSNQVIKNISMIIGRVYNFQQHPEYDVRSGLNKKHSDYVSAINFHLTDNVYFIHKMHLAAKDGQVLRQDIHTFYTQPTWNLMLTYSEVNKKLIDPTLQIYPKDLYLTANYNFYPQWWVGVGGRRKLGEKINTVSKKIVEFGSLHYQGDCLNVLFTVQRDHTKLRDLRPSTTYVINIQIPTF